MEIFYFEGLERKFLLTFFGQLGISKMFELRVK